MSIYLNLQFNPSAKKVEGNTYKVTYERYSVDLDNGANTDVLKNKYFLMGKDANTGEQVTFYIAHAILQQLKPNRTYTFKLSDNVIQGADTNRILGVCNELPEEIQSLLKPASTQKTSTIQKQ